MARRFVIGTRESPLAIRQAEMALQQLATTGAQLEIKGISSDGDVNTTTPLYEMGVQGIFTRTLDAALLEGTIDFAVHSMKDMPVVPAQGIAVAAVLKRDSPMDIWVGKEGLPPTENTVVTVGTSSIRRKAQWLRQYPSHRVMPIRGNVNTRLQKLQAGEWDGIVFAEAGLDRLNLKPDNHIVLNWMLPAPAQGAIVVVCRANDAEALACGNFANHRDTFCCVTAERTLLKGLHGGCSSPISALATAQNGKLTLKGNILSPDGKHMLETEVKGDMDAYMQLAGQAVQQLLKAGAQNLLAK